MDVQPDGAAFLMNDAGAVLLFAGSAACLTRSRWSFGVIFALAAAVFLIAFSERLGWAAPPVDQAAKGVGLLALTLSLCRLVRVIGEGFRRPLPRG